jgi:hypothetical protein
MDRHNLPETDKFHVTIMEVVYVVSDDCTSVDVEIQVGPHGQPLFHDTVDMVTFENVSETLRKSGIPVSQMSSW